MLLQGAAAVAAAAARGLPASSGARRALAVHLFPSASLQHNVRVVRVRAVLTNGGVLLLPVLLKAAREPPELRSGASERASERTPSARARRCMRTTRLARKKKTVV